MSPADLPGVVDRPGERTVGELLDAHTAQLGTAIEATGVEAAAALLAQQADSATGQDLLAEALDELLFGMTAGVLNVDIVAAELDSDLEPREVQQALEGRYPVTLGQYVELQRLIASRSG